MSRKRAPRYVLGLDGEGIGREPHRYTLLAVSDAEGKRTAHIADADGLSSLRCLTFLTSIPKDARVYGYYLGYDWTMMLRDLPNAALYALFRPALRRIPKGEGGGFTPVRWRHFELHYLAGMMRITDKKRRKSVTVWDVGRFYQAPFVREEGGKYVGALPSWKVGTEAQWARIAEMKAKRSTFESEDPSKVLGYCLEECQLLAVLVQELNAAHDAAGLHLRSWHGPGSTASNMLRAMGIKKKRGKQPDEVRVAAAYAFFGGRFEHSCSGRIEGPIYGFDICSAYPAECVELPCLEHARWTHTTREKDLEKARAACVHFILDATREERLWGCLPIRLADGNIVFPRSGASGWVWEKEFKAARAHWNNVRFLEAWILRSDCDCVPFARIADWYLERLRIGKNGKGLVLKLGYNSCYGKLAQCVGDPPFASRVWAGMITSGTRAKLLGAIAQREDDVLAVATDGIYSRAPLDLDIGNKLGQWEAKTHDRITLVRPGIYWTESSVRARGLGRKQLSEQQERIAEALIAEQEKVELPPITQFGGALACVYLTQSGEIRRAHRFGEWFDRPCRVSFDPAPKRAPNYGLWDLPGIESEPYMPARLSKAASKLKREAELSWGNL